MNYRRIAVSSLGSLVAVGALLLSADSMAAAPIPVPPTPPPPPAQIQGIQPGFQFRAASFSDQACVVNYWSGIINNCARPVAVQAAVTIYTAGSYDTNVNALAGSSSTLQTWGVNTQLDWIWTNGARSHNTDYYGKDIWGGFFGNGKTYVPAGGGLLYQVVLLSGQRISGYSVY
jgi:hypothetical protein